MARNFSVKTDKGKNKFVDDLFSQLDSIEKEVNQLNAKNGIKVVSTPTEKRQVAQRIAEQVKPQVIEDYQKQKKPYTQKRKELAKKVSEMARQANKRLDRLEKNGLEKQSVYAEWQENGAIRFSVKGKSYQQLQAEYWRVKNFLDAQTSTIKGAKQNLQRLLTEVGDFTKDDVKKLNINQLKSATKNYFDVYKGLKKQFEMQGQTAKALDYNRLFNAINQYFKKDTELIGTDNKIDVDSTINQIMENMKQENKINKDIDLW